MTRTTPRMGRKERFAADQHRAFETAHAAKSSRGVELVATTGSLSGPKPLGVVGRGLSLQSVSDRRPDGLERREAPSVTVSATVSLSVPVSSTALPEGFVAVPEAQRPSFRSKPSKVFQGVTFQGPVADPVKPVDGIIGRTLANGKGKA